MLPPSTSGGPYARNVVLAERGSPYAPTTATAPTERRRAYNEAMAMKIHKPSEHPVDRFDIDHGVSDAPPPPRRQSNAQAPGYWWNATTQELIPILPEDHPDYRQNAQTIAAAIRRWSGKALK
jgi:hypothetical protein